MNTIPINSITVGEERRPLRDVSELTHALRHTHRIRFFTRGSHSKAEHEAQGIALCAIIPKPLLNNILAYGELHDFPPDILKQRIRLFEPASSQ